MLKKTRAHFAKLSLPILSKITFLKKMMGSDLCNVINCLCNLCQKRETEDMGSSLGHTFYSKQKDTSTHTWVIFALGCKGLMTSWRPDV